MGKTIILCMDDDPMVLEVIQGFFESKNYTVFTALNGKDGLELLCFHQPDVVLVDLNMPVMNGFQVLDVITRDYPEIPSIIISGEGDMEDVIMALQLGAWQYLTKPIENYAIVSHVIEQSLEKALLMKQNKAYQVGLEKRLGAIIEHFRGYVLMCSPDYRITYMNPALVHYLGENCIGRMCSDVFADHGSGCAWFPNEDAISNNNQRLEIQNPNDGNWFDVTHLAILGHDRKVKEYQIILQDITEQKQIIKELHEREENLLIKHNRLLASLSDRFRFGDIVGKSRPMQEIYKTIISAANTEASVIVYGESGTGKELVARSIHDNSDRCKDPFVCVNCGAIPENLIESEFFGYTKGAFSGADKDKEGFLGTADGGTLFLDEVGEIPRSLQTKLLRAIEGGGYTPLGSNESRIPDVRIISATNRNLKQLVLKGKIGEDFLYRIHVVPIHLPPLRERTGDLPILIEHFFQHLSPDKKMCLPLEMGKMLENYPWPGNVRELQNTIQRYLAIGKIDFMVLEQPQAVEIPKDEEIEIHLEAESLSTAMNEVERKMLIKSLERFNYHKSKIANHLRIDRKTLYRKLKHHNLNKMSGNH